MLHAKVLPAGAGHTTNCFIRLRGTEEEAAYACVPGSDERQNVDDLQQLAPALCVSLPPPPLLPAGPPGPSLYTNACTRAHGTQNELLEQGILMLVFYGNKMICTECAYCLLL